MTDHEECIKITYRTKHHDSNEYEKAPRLWYTLNSQASIGFVDNLQKSHARTDSWNESLNSMPCSFDDRLEFLENVYFMLKEPLTNNELRAMQ